MRYELRPSRLPSCQRRNPHLPGRWIAVSKKWNSWVLGSCRFLRHHRDALCPLGYGFVDRPQDEDVAKTHFARAGKGRFSRIAEAKSSCRTASCSVSGRVSTLPLGSTRLVARASWDLAWRRYSERSCLPCRKTPHFSHARLAYRVGVPRLIIGFDLARVGQYVRMESLRGLQNPKLTLLGVRASIPPITIHRPHEFPSPFVSGSIFLFAPIIPSCRRHHSWSLHRPFARWALRPCALHPCRPQSPALSAAPSSMVQRDFRSNTRPWP